nr:hypothetical protein [Tanacetum cinerariifolium]
MTYVNSISIDNLKNEAPRKKGIKSTSKLLSLKYQSQSSLEEHNRNSSSSKRIHFINSIIILKKKNEPKEEEIIEPSATKDNDHNIMVKMEDEAMKREESYEEIEDKETKEET